MKYGVQAGQIYLAADNTKCGYVVIDVKEYEDVDDALVIGFTSEGFSREARRIDLFKLAMVRYYLTDNLPDWLPREYI